MPARPTISSLGLRNPLVRAMKVPVLTRCNANIASTDLSNGTDTLTTYRTRHVAPKRASGLVLRYGNFRCNSGDTAGPNDVTYRAAIEYPAGTFYPAFKNGKRDFLIEPGAIGDFDRIGVDVAEGDFVYVRTCPTVASVGMKWPLGTSTASANGEGATAGSDLTISGTVTTATVFSAGPLAVLGTTNPPNPITFGIIGDSIPYGQADTPGDLGFVVRGINDLFAWVRVTKAGELGSGFQTTGRRCRMTQLRECSHCYEHYGANDLNAAQTMAQLQVSKISIWRAGWIRGQKMYTGTVLPRTTSTDSFATTTNQTPNSGFAVGWHMMNYNTWLRDGAPMHGTTFAAVAAGDATSTTIRIGSINHPLAGYADIYDAVAVSRLNPVFQVGFTIDGTHLVAAGAIAAAVPWAALIARMR